MIIPHSFSTKSDLLLNRLTGFVFYLLLYVLLSGCKKDLPQHCSNGIKDDDEIGIDCGGSCKACTQTDIYIAGSGLNNLTGAAKYWKNGVRIDIESSNLFGNANCVVAVQRQQLPNLIDCVAHKTIKMKNKTSLIILSALMLFWGCKKKNDEPGLPKIKTSIKQTFFAGAGFDTLTYSYNEYGNVSMILMDNGEKQIYTYTGTSVTCVHYSGNGSILITFNYLLNSAGLADSLIVTDNFGSGRQKFVYDANGFLIKQRYYGFNGNPNIYTGYDTTINNSKNVTSYWRYDATNNLIYNSYFQYFTDNTNTIGNDATGMSFLGKSSQNGLSFTYSFQSGGGHDVDIYTYSYDTKDRVNYKYSFSVTGDTLEATKFIYY